MGAGDRRASGGETRAVTGGRRTPSGEKGASMRKTKKEQGREKGGRNKGGRRREEAQIETEGGKERGGNSDGGGREMQHAGEG